jgi:hypothetical protein
MHPIWKPLASARRAAVGFILIAFASQVFLTTSSSMGQQTPGTQLPQIEAGRRQINAQNRISALNTLLSWKRSIIYEFCLLSLPEKETQS